MTMIAAAVFDWAGTMIDFGSIAPVRAMTEVFDAAELPVTEAAIRRHMGLAKRDHVIAILRDCGADWTNADVDALMAALEPAMLAAAADHSDLIPGATQAVDWLRRRGARIGSTTGYTRAMMAGLIPAAREQGYAPETIVCAGEVAAGRPAPLMLWKALADLSAWPVSRCIAIDDAPAGIAAGRNAGVWTVGVAASGNAVGLPLAEYRALTDAGRAQIQGVAAASLTAAGADIVIASVADLPEAVDRIEAALTLGRLPGQHPPATCL